MRTVTTAAFDALLVARTNLTVWSARGFVSADLCGFDVFVDHTAVAPGDLDRLLAGPRWWDIESPENTLRVGLTCDGVRIPLTLGGGTGGSQDDGRMTVTVGVEFPTPTACSSLVLTMGADPWVPPTSVKLDAALLASSLQRWPAFDTAD